MKNEQVLLQTEDDKALTLGQALRDLGFMFWLFTAVVGAPSIVSLMQTVFVDFKLTELLQWLVDGYRDLLNIVGATLEPLANGLLAGFSGLFDVDLTLQKHWQPLFIVLGIFISTNTRTLWDDGYRKPAITFVLVMICFTLIGSWISGVIAPNADWWLQGLAAGAPVLCLFLGLTLAYWLADLMFGFAQPYRKPLWHYPKRGAVLAIAAFALAALIAILPTGRSHAGLLVLFSGLFLYGLYWTYAGFRDRDVPEVRFGLRVVGGFLFASLVLAIDFGFQLTGAA